MPRKKTVQKRTPGFTTIDKEVHDLLDTVRPIAERLYRKLHQRINQKRGDRVVFPTWEQLINDTGITNRRTLNKAIKELELAHLIVVDRSYNKDLQRKNVNKYYIVTTAELSQWQNYQKPVAKLPKASGKTATVTRMKRTRMNITNMNKGTGKSKKEKSANSSPPVPARLSPDVSTRKNGASGKTAPGSGPKPMSAEELQAADAKWKAREEYMRSLS